jgi:hypothetical protein
VVKHLCVRRGLAGGGVRHPGQTAPEAALRLADAAYDDLKEYLR